MPEPKKPKPKKPERKKPFREKVDLIRDVPGVGKKGDTEIEMQPERAYALMNSGHVVPSGWKKKK